MRPKTILIVEDEKPLREALEAKLRRDFETIETSDGEEGLKAAIEQEPDLILLDIIMPKMDGFTMAKKLRAYERSKGILANNQIPIIFLTNLAEERGMGEGQKRGIYDYLVKSNWTLDSIVKKIKDKLNI